MEWRGGGGVEKGVERISSGDDYSKSPELRALERA